MLRLKAKMAPVIKTLCLAGVGSAMLIGSYVSSQPKHALSPQAIDVEAKAVPLHRDDPRRETLGWLHYRGGVHIQSSDQRFGGLSGLRWADQKLYAVSDAGDWFAINPQEAGERLTGIESIEISRLMGRDGRPISGKHEADAEAFTFGYGDCVGHNCSPQNVTIAFERDHRLWQYPFKNGVPSGRPAVVPLPAAWTKALRNNGGMEVLAGDPDQTIYVFAEGKKGAAGHTHGLMRHRHGSRKQANWQHMSLPFLQGMQPTDADMLDDERLIIVYRHYSLLGGVKAAVAIGRVQQAVNAGAVVTPSLLDKPAESATESAQIVLERWFALSAPFTVDNIEGVAVRTEGSRTFIYIISDNNFSALQRTLLLKFELLEG